MNEEQIKEKAIQEQLMDIHERDLAHDVNDDPKARLFAAAVFVTEVSCRPSISLAPVLTLA